MSACFKIALNVPILTGRLWLVITVRLPSGCLKTTWFPFPDLETKPRLVSTFSIFCGLIWGNFDMLKLQVRRKEEGAETWVVVTISC